MTARPPDIDSAAARQQLRQLDLLFEYSRLPQWLVMLAAGVVTLLVWDHVASSAALSWLLLICLLTLLRTRLARQYRRSPPEQRQRPHWAALFYLGNGISGLAMGSVHLLLVPVDTFNVQAGAYAVTTGVALCVSIIYAHRFSAFLTFALPSWLPPTLFLWMQPDPSSPYWALMSITLFSCMLLAAAFINRSAKRSLQGEIRNEALLYRLDEARQQAEALNIQLTGEIEHRRQAEQQLRNSHEALEHRVAQRTQELQQTQARLSMALEASALGLWDWDLRTDEVHHSHLQEIFGLPDTPLTMRGGLRPRVHPEDTQRVRSALIQHFQQTTPYCVEYRVRHRDGHWVWVEDNGRAIERDSAGRVLRMIGTRRDITERRHRHEQERLAATVFEATSDGIFILDPERRILAVNQAFSVITGYPARDVIGRVLTSASTDPDTQATYARMGTALRHHDRWEGEVLEQRRSGERYPQWLQLTVVRNPAGEITHIVGFFADRTINHRAEEQLRYLTDYDSLTQLANRSLFSRKLAEATSQARARGNELALLHIDLDRFKNINETLGHVQADALLRQVAERLAAQLPQAVVLARLSADEFVAVKQNLPRHALAQLATRLLQVLGEPIRIGDNELIISASIGISLFPREATNSLQLINQANQAMQHAKNLGGNGFQFHSADLPTRSADRLHLEHELRRAIADGQLQIHYQPKQQLASNRIDSAEALVRWQHPTRGAMLPGDFISIAEETGLILPLGDQVLRRACAQASQWLREGPQAVRVAVNLSGQQLRQPQFAAAVERILDETGLPGHLLELELTESMLLEHSEGVADNLAALRQLGVELSVDDFGTGYSSLAYLKRFPIRCLKIDRAFICELHEQPGDIAIVRAIIAMAHSMNLRVVAEGVEHDSQLAFLRSLGCDEVQGFLISRPLPAADFARLMALQVSAASASSRALP
ncbi:PAS/PAC sensor-containing diguanylate cyclase/phosphodiesterase [Pseudomonas saudimassiliensis]|uniref:cyclic-guanylate-specific phosphodiesterase n=1 Tax=Pseudomonas saudimassiliensis TaxID=1461581 RepID=A0A078MB05_9PSED|nr:GGDEF domain-containing phosphodiesterase [Pseudomonas saudimassiliensis]CEA04583.1 PAS/PAC sensor-containing diguanylate cyclase/phosphodiesterase [Pseudomonas saudimassiliensis]CEF26697.1 PAS/PAC sensor-containing diguanylate cyclase/phosphodiesterase [Pseudomonas saudimassiliensis]